MHWIYNFKDVDHVDTLKPNAHCPVWYKQSWLHFQTRPLKGSQFWYIAYFRNVLYVINLTVCIGFYGLSSWTVRYISDFIRKAISTSVLRNNCKFATILNHCIPIPGVEPGPPGWKPGILTARPYGSRCSYSTQLYLKSKGILFLRFSNISVGWPFYTSPPPFHDSFLDYYR